MIKNVSYSITITTPAESNVSWGMILLNTLKKKWSLINSVISEIEAFLFSALAFFSFDVTQLFN